MKLLARWRASHLFLALFFVASVGCRSSSYGGAADIFDGFVSPPAASRPGVYWYFMDGNQDRAGMEADLEAMSRVGINKVVYLEVNIGVPRGPVDFMSEQWQDNFAFAVRTAERLGMEVILGTGPGWAGSGGPWVAPEESMQHLTSGTTEIVGPVHFSGQLEVPVPAKPNHFHGMSDELSRVRDEWYQDVAVLAFPTPENAATIEMADLKTLKETQPYSIWKHVPRYVPVTATFDEPDASAVIDPVTIVDLTDRMDSDGNLSWKVPEGRWTVMRFVSRTTGQTTRPAPTPGHGFETDKFDPQAFRNHWENFQGKLLEKVGPGSGGKGWTRIHLDSWEMSSQNWSQGFRDEFKKRRGYDPQPYYPAYAGMVVGSLEKTERFLWDLRKTAQELVIENYAEVIKSTANGHGMSYSNQPYDMNPAGNIDLGSVADIPSCEFWDYRNSDLVDTLYTCIAATSIAHTMGRAIVPAEAFTSVVPNRFHSYPGQMKNQTDWALAFGITNFIFHTFQHQPLGDEYLPGMSMGPHGVNWHRNQNWWDMLPAYHNYISRASFLLQQGVSVADVLYLTPEAAPHIFLPPSDALDGSGVLRDKRGYSFDAVSPRILMQRAQVQGDRVHFPEASNYRVLVLPDVDTMTPEALKKILELLEAGATIVGNPPVKSPSLQGYPTSDERVAELVGRIWGDSLVPAKQTARSVGNGTLYWGRDIYEEVDSTQNLYPNYERAAHLLEEAGLKKDFESPGGALRFIHRRTDNQDFYFVSNRTDQVVETSATFRVTGRTPELWHPETGERRNLPEFTESDSAISVPLKFVPYESFFVVFSDEGSNDAQSKVNFPAQQSVMSIDGAWNVAFDPRRGGPETTTFETLQDWRDHGDSGVKYYSGIATYTTTFDLPEGADPFSVSAIDLGNAYEMARVSLNGEELGIVWTAPWQVPVGDALKAKDNVLSVEVANSWENRLIGDQMEDDKDVRTVRWESGLLEGKEYKTGRYTFTTYVNEASDFGEIQIKAPELQPSGLIGPVRLIK